MAFEQTISIRGEAKKVVIHGAHLRLKAHGQKRFIIALKYEGETEYRYLVTSILTWRLTGIACAYTLRWLVEVFIQDWKSEKDGANWPSSQVMMALAKALSLAY